jgi:hypothetical protein
MNRKETGFRNTERLNSKLEIRNPKQIQSSKIQMTKTASPPSIPPCGGRGFRRWGVGEFGVVETVVKREAAFRILNLGHLDLFRISDFGFRI